MQCRIDCHLNNARTVSAIQWCIAERLEDKHRGERLFPEGVSTALTTSAVLVTLGAALQGPCRGMPCIVLNKRSRNVKQPGDLCFPGGRTSPRLDRLLSRMLKLPFSPLTRWPGWPSLRMERPDEARRLSLLLATSLRESFEEMRLNPLGISFLGPLPPQPLELFRRVIYPMVAWVTRQKRFRPNWEVEKIVRIPLRDLLEPERYACYRVELETVGVSQPMVEDFPCFAHRDGQGQEILWGATYRIVEIFLEVVFGFRPPAPESLPVIRGSLGRSYFSPVSP